MPEQERKKRLEVAKAKSSTVLSRKRVIVGVATITLGGAYGLVRFLRRVPRPQPKPSLVQPFQREDSARPSPYRRLTESAPIDVQGMDASPQREAKWASINTTVEGLERDVKELREKGIKDREEVAKIGVAIVEKIDALKQLPRPEDEDEIRRWKALVKRTRKLFSLLATGTSGAVISQDVYPLIREKVKELLDRLDPALAEDGSVPEPKVKPPRPRKNPRRVTAQDQEGSL